MLRLMIIASMFLSVLVCPLVAHAQYSIKEMTPAVKSALDNRRGRYDQLQVLKREKAIGENNRGYVTVLIVGVDIEQTVAAENADRKTIYKTIAEQNNLGDALETIEKVFGEVQSEKAGAGEMVQTASGEWISK